MTSTSGSPTRLALVTGASSCIGRAFARRLGVDRYSLVVVGLVVVGLVVVGLVVVGRCLDRLEELVAALPNVQVCPLVADLGTDACIMASIQAGTAACGTAWMAGTSSAMTKLAMTKPDMTETRAAASN